MGTRCADHVTPLCPQKLALTSPTGGGRSVGIVRLRTKATEFSFSLQRVLKQCAISWYFKVKLIILHGNKDEHRNQSFTELGVHELFLCFGMNNSLVKSAQALWVHFNTCLDRLTAVHLLFHKLRIFHHNRKNCGAYIAPSV